MTSHSPDQGRVRVPKTAELVASRIRGQIAAGTLKADDALPSESILMEEYSVSRPTLREAFRILEAERLITVRRGARGGARVQIPDHDAATRYMGLILQYRQVTLADVFEARTTVEAPAARILASRADRKKSAAALREALEVERQDANSPSHSTELHSLLVELTGNEALILLTRMLERITEAAALSLRDIDEEDPRQVQRSHRAHARLVELIEAGEADAAEELWRKHLEAGGAYLLRAAGGNVLELLA